MTCRRCEGLTNDVDIRLPQDLKNAIAMAKAAVREGVIEEAESFKLDEPFSTIESEGPWEDTLSYRFQCRDCDQRFELAAETYFGSGGCWKVL